MNALIATPFMNSSRAGDVSSLSLKNLATMDDGRPAERSELHITFSFAILNGSSNILRVSFLQ